MPESRASAVTIGAYDGVHLGHRRVIETLRSLALAEGLRSVVVTFDRHPASVVRPESAPKLLTDLEHKLELLASLGVDDVEVVRFDEARATETAEDFVDEVLVGQLAARVIVVGRDFHFGKARGGNVALLEEMGGERGFRVVPFELVDDEARHEVVSSTRIRRLVARGALAEAAALLARPYEVRGTLAAAGGGRAQSVSVPEEILLPPPGGFRAEIGPLATGGTLAPVFAEVLPGEEGDSRIIVAGATHRLRNGSRVRVVFDGGLSAS